MATSGEPVCHTRPRAIRRQVPVPLGFNVLFVGCLTAAPGASWKWAGDRPHLPCARVLLQAFPGLIPRQPSQQYFTRGGTRTQGPEAWSQSGGSREVAEAGLHSRQPDWLCRRQRHPPTHTPLVMLTPHQGLGESVIGKLPWRERSPAPKYLLQP